MANRVKGITVEIGGDVTGLDKALSGVNKNINNTQKELKDVERLLKLDPTNVELLEQKQRLLSEAVDETGDKLDTLKEAEKQVQKQFERGDIGQEQYDRLKREIIQTENQLDGFKKSAVQAEKAVEKIDEDPVEDVEQAADDAAEALDNAGESANTFGDMLSAGAIIEGVKSLVGAVGELRDATEEYRKIMGTLETSSDAAGYTAEQTQEAYNRLYGVLGDDQSTATTVANLQAMGLKQGDLMRMIDLTTGAWATYGDSIPIDGLAEAINETTKAGQVTGVLADAINWGAREGETYGVRLKQNIQFTKLNEKQLKSLTEEQRAAYEQQKQLYDETEAYNKSVMDAASAEDFFNIALKNCKTESERANLIMQALSGQGLEQTANSWRENNDGIVKTNDAQADYMKNAREIAEKTDPAAIAAKQGMADVLGKISEALDQIDMNKLAEDISGFFNVLGNGITWMIENSDAVMGILIALGSLLGVSKGVGLVAKLGLAAQGVNGFATAFPGLTSAISGFLSNPYVLLVAALVALVAYVGINGDKILAKLDEVDTYMQGVFAKDWGETFGPVLGEPVRAFQQNLKNAWDGIMQHANAAVTFWRDVFAGNWKDIWADVKNVFSSVWHQMVNIAKMPVNAIIGMVNGMMNAIESAVNGAINLLNKIPGVNIGSVSAPTLHYMASGGTLSRGAAIVGEAGPELLTMAHGSAKVQPIASPAQRGSNATGAPVYGGPQTIVVQSVLDGRVIGETAYNYSREVARAYGN